MLSRLVALRSDPAAIPGIDSDTATTTPGTSSEKSRDRDGDKRRHLVRLYPLLVRAARVAAHAGDAEVGTLLGDALEVLDGGFGVRGSGTDANVRQ